MQLEVFFTDGIRNLIDPSNKCMANLRIIPKNTVQMFICAFYTVYNVHTFQIPLVLETVST
jgi:hypothetical protein